MESKDWSRKTFVSRVAEVVDYGLDNYQGNFVPNRGYPPPPWVKDYPDDITGQKEAAMSVLYLLAYIVACFTAQHTPKGFHGVEAETVFESLRLWETLLPTERKALIGKLWDDHQ